MKKIIGGITIQTTKEVYNQNWWGSPQYILNIYNDKNKQFPQRIYVHKEGLELLERFLLGIK